MVAANRTPPPINPRRPSMIVIDDGTPDGWWLYAPGFGPKPPSTFWLGFFSGGIVASLILLVVAARL